MKRLRTTARSLWLVAALTTILIAPPPVEAAVKRDAYAPEIDTRSLVNASSFSLRALRGRMVLLEFFGTECPHCRKAVPRMNEIQSRYRSQGVAVVGLTPDGRDKVLQYRRSFGAQHPIAVVPLDVLREYGVTEYPIGFLISPNGRVLWRGRLERLTNRVIDAYLKRVKTLPRAPVGYEATAAELAARRYGRVHRLLERHRQCDGLSRSDCRFVLDVLDWIDWFVESTEGAIKKDADRGRWYSAWRGYDELATSFAGLEVGTRAAAQREALIADPTWGVEIQAARALYDARRRGRSLSNADAAELIEPVVRQYGQTKAGAEAKTLLRMLRVK